MFFVIALTLSSHHRAFNKYFLENKLLLIFNTIYNANNKTPTKVFLQHVSFVGILKLLIPLHKRTQFIFTAPHLLHLHFYLFMITFPKQELSISIAIPLHIETVYTFVFFYINHSS